MNRKSQKTAIIIGAGPAGLTAAYELLKKTNVKPIVIESTKYIGGLSKTVDYKGNKIDIGGHRFFSKSDKVMNWWQNILPLDTSDVVTDIKLKYQGKERKLNMPINQVKNGDMLLRSRKSRILHGGKFFSYPISLSADTLNKLGLIKVIKIASSYAYSKLLPLKPEDNLEKFFINRFGNELYKTFFKDYTEKVWGISCSKISSEWGAQRVKGLSVTKAILHNLRFGKNDVYQRSTETSLIEHFLYPRYGPGQMWETVAKNIKANGGEIIQNASVKGIGVKNGIAKTVTYEDKIKKRCNKTDYVISTMPVNELITTIKGIDIPKRVKEVAKGLEYRDFITVGILMHPSKSKVNQIDDNWIYVQEPHLKVGRIQVFNNWSPYLVKENHKLWVGLEYFVNESDSFWQMTDIQIKKFAQKELGDLKIFSGQKICDSVVIREKKAYPAYFGSYNNFNVIQKFTNSIPNLFLIGRNGMHRYNNQDHSMLTAMKAAELIKERSEDKDALWQINSEEIYQES